MISTPQKLAETKGKAESFHLLPALIIMFLMALFVGAVGYILISAW